MAMNAVILTRGGIHPLDRDLEERLLDEIEWDAVGWPVGEVPLVERCRRAGWLGSVPSPPPPPPRWRCRFVVTRPSAVYATGFHRALALPPDAAARDPDGARGMDMETYEPYEAWLTTVAPDVVASMARAAGISEYVPTDMIADYHAG